MQKTYIEITNLDHGSLGWELGMCLWSPVYNRNGKTKSWKLMEEVNVDDIIIHLVKIKNVYHFYGISKAASEVIRTGQKPVHSGIWSPPYQRINLEYFNALSKQI